MKFVGFRTLAAALLLPAIIAHAGALPAAPRVGDTYEITLTKDSVQHGSNKSSSTSHDKNAIIERVIGQRADGLELEYDLPPATTADDRARQWQFPARVFKPFGAPAQLRNGPELNARLDSWPRRNPVSVFGEWEFSCDRQATMDAYARAIHGRSDVCVCNGCRNFVAARGQAYPHAFKELLDSLGIDSRKDGEVITTADWLPAYTTTADGFIL